MKNTGEKYQGLYRPRSPGLPGLPSLLLLAILLGVLGASVAPQAKPVASAQTDRLDPGSCEQVEASRSALAEAENGAVCVQEVCDRLPAGWPEAQLLQVQEQPPHLLPEEDGDRLRRELAQAETARETARRLADLPRGHFPPALMAGPFPSRKPFLCAQTCSRLLEWQAWLEAQQQDADGALRSLRCLVHAGAAIDSEPQVLAQLSRLAIQNQACRTLECILALTEPGDASLQAVEQVLRREQEQPLLLWMTCGERAEAEIARPPQPEALRFWSRAIEIGRAPTLAHRPLLQALQLACTHQRPSLQEPVAKLTQLVRAWLDRQSRLSCAITALAVERYRLRHRRWPARLADLVPDLLPAIPCDPFDGEPLGYRPLADGVLVSSVGIDGKDAGGFRLWDPRHRRQKPLPSLHREVFGFGPATDRQSCFLPPHRERSS